MQTAPEQRWYERPRTIFWIALAVRLLVILIGHTYKIRTRDHNWEFGYEAGRLASHLVTGQGYSSPFNGPSGPSAWLPPLYPLLMAGCFKLFGVYSRLSAFMIMAIDSVFSALTVPAVYEFARRCFDAHGLFRRRSKMAAPVAVWCAWVFALHPEVIQYPIHWIWEMSLSTCLFAWALVIALRLRGVGYEGQGSRVEGQVGLWIWFGLLWGLVALANATLLSVLPFAIGWILWTRIRESGPWSPIAGAFLSCVIVGVVMTPWIVRNERAMHAFIPTRSNFGIEFWNATRWQYGAFPWGSAVPLNTAEDEWKLFAQMGEVKYAHMRGQQAIANIKAAPREYLRDTMLRTQFFWYIWPHPMEAKPVSEAFRLFNYGFISTCGLLGLLLVMKRRVPGRWLMFWVMMLVPIPYYLVTVQARFRYPMEPVMCVLSVALFRATEKRASRV